jgi:hypothetical protein
MAFVPIDSLQMTSLTKADVGSLLLHRVGAESRPVLVCGPPEDRRIVTLAPVDQGGFTTAQPFADVVYLAAKSFEVLVDYETAQAPHTGPMPAGLAVLVGSKPGFYVQSNGAEAFIGLDGTWLAPDGVEDYVVFSKWKIFAQLGDQQKKLVYEYGEEQPQFSGPVLG